MKLDIKSSMLVSHVQKEEAAVEVHDTWQGSHRSTSDKLTKKS